LFKNRFLQFIGATSYSFYLLHFVILIAISPILYALVPSFAMIWISALLLSYLAAFMLFKTVEMPFHRLGTRLAKAIQKPRPSLRGRCETSEKSVVVAVPKETWH
jgi:peptidoglycan/LPS O-acetylase OafA/YrhL